MRSSRESKTSAPLLAGSLAWPETKRCAELTSELSPSEIAAVEGAEMEPGFD